MARKRTRSTHKQVLHRIHARRKAAQKKLEAQFAHVLEKLNSLEFDLSKLRHRSAQVLSATALAGALLATTPVISAQLESEPIRREAAETPEQLQERTHRELLHVLPSNIGPLSPSTEAHISDVLKRTLGIRATAVLEDQHLNTSYGYIGAEQHLPRFAGDSIGLHDALQFKGITAGRGAFGYFAQNHTGLTEEAIQQKKYYVVVQTLYLPNWNKDHRWLKEWYKFRKVLVVNPVNGKSMVAVIGDAGPAAWTGKQFGGSPELMEYLQLKDGRQKGGVILFFVDETHGQVALGPVESKLPAFLASH